MVRTDDLDGDGVLDFAVPELAPVRGVGVLFVSTTTLKVLCRCECKGVLAAVGTWVPATSTSKAGLLLTAQTKTGTSLLWIEPNR